MVRQNPASKSHLPLSVEIPENKEASIALDRNARETIKIYTDGSAINGKVGAAAILTRTGKADRTLRVCMGTTEEHTVAEAELVGLILGLHLIATEKRSRVKCVIGLDNQAIIKALHTDLTNPGHHLTAEALKIAERLGKRSGGRRYKLTIRWTAGHAGIRGNEKADREAKRAAHGLTSDRKDLPRYVRGKIKHSISAIRQLNNKSVNDTWKRQWQASKRYTHFRTKDTISPTSQKFLLLTSDHRIERKMASLVFQLRTGHAPLNEYLYRFKKVDSARCPACGEQNETVEHFLLLCPKYAHERWPLLQKTRRTVPSVTEILSNKNLILPLINYIEATERFKV